MEPISAAVVPAVATQCPTAGGGSDLIAPTESGLPTRTTMSEYCEYARNAKRTELWWYCTGLAPFRGYSRPFRDHTGRWWFCVKPRFAWPVDYFKPVAHEVGALTFTGLLGRQFPIADPSKANSRVWMNVIHDLAGYGLERIDSDKRRAVRKGQKNLDLRIVDPSDPRIAEEACPIWNSHVERTGWNQAMKCDEFAAGWRELAAWPGTTVLATRDKQTGVMCSWLIGRIIDEVAYVDTVASHTDRLASRPNDTMIVEFLMRAAAIGVKHAHYSLVSRLAPLEAFKQSLGFVQHPFPTRLVLRWPMGPLMRRFSPDTWKRLQGDPNAALPPAPPPEPQPV